MEPSISRLEELRQRHARAEEGGGAERKQRQHNEGKLSARERIDARFVSDSLMARGCRSDRYWVSNDASSPVVSRVEKCVVYEIHTKTIGALA